MRIKEAIKENGYTQQMLADKMNVSLSAVKQMVSAESLTTTTLGKIADALNIPVWQLFASPKDISTSFVCPNCGASLELKIKK